MTAPIRYVAGQTIAAISIASAAQYMSDHRMQKLGKDPVNTLMRISKGLGWTERHPAAATETASRAEPRAGRRRPPARGH